MKAQIFSYEKLIGTTELYVGDDSMGGLYGEFFPEGYYYESVQKAAWKIWTSGGNKWDSLGLNVRLNNGCFIYAAGGITLHDLPKLPAEPKQIDIAGVDRYIIEDFILPGEARLFVIEPWDAISIGQKMTFELELAKELGLVAGKKDFWGFFKPTPHDHPLSDAVFTALCNNGDDVLFRIKKPGSGKMFAAVHLTWRGGLENRSFPEVEFYEDFDDFKHSRMYPDKAEWEY